MRAIITVGIPASGKTTWAEQQNDYINLNLDDFRGMIAGDPSDQTVNKQAVEMRDQALAEAMRSRKNIIISDTNINPFFRDKLISKFVEAGYKVDLNVFDIPLDVALERNSSRQRQVPEDVIRNMMSSLNKQIEDNSLLSPKIDRLISSNIAHKVTPISNAEQLIRGRINDLSNEQNVIRTHNGISFPLAEAIRQTGLTINEFSSLANVSTDMVKMHKIGQSYIDENTYEQYKRVLTEFGVKVPVFKAKTTASLLQDKNDSYVSPSSFKHASEALNAGLVSKYSFSNTTPKHKIVKRRIKVVIK